MQAQSLKFVFKDVFLQKGSHINSISAVNKSFVNTGVGVTLIPSGILKLIDKEYLFFLKA